MPWRTWPPPRTNSRGRNTATSNLIGYFVNLFTPRPHSQLWIGRTSRTPRGRSTTSAGLPATGRRPVTRRAQRRVYGSHRGNHGVVMLGAFTNVRIENQLLDEVEMATRYPIPSGMRRLSLVSEHRCNYETLLITIACVEFCTQSSQPEAMKTRFRRISPSRYFITSEMNRFRRTSAWFPLRLILVGVLGRPQLYAPGK